MFPSRINVLSIARLRLHRTFSERTSGIITTKDYDSLPIASTKHAPVLPEWDGGLDEPKLVDRERIEPDIVSNSKKYDQKTIRRIRKLSGVTTRLKSEKPQLTEVTKTEGRNKREPRNQLAKEILENLNNFPHCILLTRVGQFYESYFDQAKDVSRLLSIKLTHKTWDGQHVWMCGFPIMHLDKYLKMLVQDNKRNVALCEEFLLPRQSVDDPKVFSRRVVRILTPGTLIDESFVNPFENNYLLAIKPNDANPETIGLAWTDLSTGEFFARSIGIKDLADQIARIAPKEIVLYRAHQSVLAVASEEINCPKSYVDSYSTEINCQDIATGANGEATDEITAGTDDVNVVFTADEKSAIHLLNLFLRQNLLKQSSPSMIARDVAQRRMQIDAHTLKALEIRESSSESTKGGSLLSTIKNTVTTSGTRLLMRWLTAPSTSVREIEARHSLVEMFRVRPALCDDVRKYLESVDDVTRIVQKFQLNRGEIEDLRAIKRTILVWEALKSRIMSEKLYEVRQQERPDAREDWLGIDTLIDKMSDLRWLADRIDAVVEENDNVKSVDEDDCADEESSNVNPSTEPGEGNTDWKIKPEFSTELASMHQQLIELYSKRDELQSVLQQHYDAPSLTLKTSTSNFGSHVHIAKPRRDLQKISQSKSFVLLSESASTKTYSYQPWHKLGTSISQVIDNIRSAERAAFEKLRSEVDMQSKNIRRNARIIDEVDITLSFALLAIENNYVRPRMSESGVFHVVNGRHPTVERGLQTSGREFMANSIDMSNEQRLQIITGPNMAGKSTFLRQVALIAIMAQTGCYVPAHSAEIGIVDRVFSRIGARDELFKDKSTFMVEMLETAEILKNATERSLVIMDEVGRGTTVRDGLAIAFAAIHYLYTQSRSRTLFATHYHELAPMLGYSSTTNACEKYPAISFFCTDVKLEDGRVIYTHRLREGVNTKSHGLLVAKLAGMPTEAVDIATRVFAALESEPSQTKVDSQALSKVLDDLAARAQ